MLDNFILSINNVDKDTFGASYYHIKVLVRETVLIFCL